MKLKSEYDGAHKAGRTGAVMNVDEAVERESKSTADKESYDAIVIGSGIGGLVAATQLAVKGAKVLVLEKYVIPGGSSGFYERDGYTFDVGSSVMFGFSDKVILCLLCCCFDYYYYFFFGVLVVCKCSSMSRNFCWLDLEL